MRSPWIAPSFLFMLACRPGAFDKLEGPEDAGDARSPSADPDAGADAPTSQPSAPQPGASPCAPGSDTCEEVQPTTEVQPTASCLGAQCSAGCEPGHADCDADRALGSASNGCETRLADDLRHCGDCGLPCTAPPDGYAVCRASRCMSVSLVREPPTALAARGGTVGVGLGGGKAFNQVCPEGEVVTGVDGKISSNTVVDSIRLRCARLTAVPGIGDAPAIVLGDGYFPYATLGGDRQLDEEGTPRAPYALYCAPGEFVTEMHIAVWQGLAVNGMSLSTVQDIALRCAKASLTPSLQVVIEASGPLLETRIPRWMDAIWSIDRCTGSALAGFTGRHGLHVDQLIGQCSALKLTVSAAAH